MREARPYVKALLACATTPVKQKPWQVFLASIKPLATHNIWQALHVSTQQKSTLLHECLPKATQPQQAFLQLLIEYNRMACVPAIAEQFQAACDKQAGVAHASITTSHAVTTKQQAELTAWANGILHQKVEATFDTDATLIGGAVLRAGDTVVDGSVCATLALLSV
jgi:F-type H+-transporting ATPase subunit delta